MTEVLARRLAAGSLLLGAGLRLWQYLGRASLRLDEIALTRNLLARGPVELISQPLDYDQVAPPAFLLIQNGVAAALGVGEFELRLVPLLASLASLPLFLVVANQLLAPAARVAAVALFALAPPFIRYGADAKPYAGDVAIALLLTVLVLAWRRKPSRGNGRALLLTGPFAVWLSHAAVFVLVGLAAAIAWDAWADSRPAKRRFAVLIVATWGVCSALAVGAAFGVMPTPRGEFFRQFWAPYLMPFPPNSLRDLTWPVVAVERLLESDVQYSFGKVLLLLVGLGAVSWWRRDRYVAIVVGVPPAVALAAAVAGRYPFSERVVLFAVPALQLLMVEGIDWLGRGRGLALRSVRAGGFVALVAMAAITGWAYRPVMQPHHVRPLLEEIRRRWRPTDEFYVYYAAWQAIEFYGPRVGFTAADLDIGGCHRARPVRYLQELDRYRGRSRVWVLFALGLEGPREKKAMLDYLDAVGVRRDSLAISPSPGGQVTPTLAASAYLYDLSDADRLAGFTAASFPLRSTSLPDWIADCAFGPEIPRVHPGARIAR